MTTWFVSRHPGAVAWARSAGVKVSDCGVVASLDVTQVKSGDLVVGTLPINVAAEVVKRGARYEHLAMELPSDARGKELSEEDMSRYGARLEHYHIELQGQTQHRPAWDGSDDYVMLVISSAQTMPNVLPILAQASLPKKLFVVVSEHPKAKNAAQVLAHLAALIELPVCFFKHAPNAPLASVQEYAETQIALIRCEFPTARIVLNATGGTKIMSAGFTRALGAVAEVIYCDTDNDCIEYFSPQGRPSLPLPPDLTDLRTYLLAKGLVITARLSDTPGWMEGVRARKELTRFLVTRLSGKHAQECEKDIGYLNKLAYQALPQKSVKGRAAQKWTPVQDYKQSNVLTKRIEDVGIWRILPNKQIEFTDEAAASYLCGGWLEEYAALTMEQLKVNPKHWGVGVKIRPHDPNANADTKQNDLNELDLAVVWRNRLLVVECKTGGQVQEVKSQDILNKLESIRSYAGGYFAQIWLLTVKFAEVKAQERAKEYHIKLYEREALALLPQLIARWMKISNKKEEEQLQAKLDELVKDRTK